jgi:hypothetical protein
MRICIALLGLVGVALLTPQTSALAADQTGVLMKDGHLVMGDVVSVNKDALKLKVDGKEQEFPLDKVDPKSVLECAKQKPDMFNVHWHFDMGSYFLKNKLYKPAEDELTAALRIDASLKAEIDPLIEQAQKGQGAKTAVAAAKDPPPLKDAKETKEATPAAKKDEPKKEPDDASPGDKSPGDKGAEDFAAKFRQMTIPPRSPAEMKDFLEKRKKDLDDQIGGTWRMIETPHFYCFSNIKEDVHKRIATDWNEHIFYDRVSRMLMHKEGDKLWNNKCPIYYFEKFEQFQKFAAVLDHAPGAGNSGGYFMAEGREVHVCIPFDVQKAGSQQEAEHHARDTVVHEGTHAFLQLTGEDVPLSRWLHEGLAQFMEFWVEKETTEHNQYGKDRRERAQSMSRLVRTDILSWEETRQRPMGGMDLVGYSYAWSKMEFLYRNFDKQAIPKMIRLIKSGKSEDEAITGAFGIAPDKLEPMYVKWLKEQSKNGFKFDQ